MGLIASERDVGYAHKPQRMTAAEFRAPDAGQTTKHAFVGGDVFAMAGGEDRLIKREPALAVEVLSPSTAAADRGDRFASCRQLPSLAEVVPVDDDWRRRDLFRKRSDDGLWVLRPSAPGEGVQLASVDLAISTGALGADLEAPATQPATQTTTQPATQPADQPRAA